MRTCDQNRMDLLPSIVWDPDHRTFRPSLAEPNTPNLDMGFLKFACGKVGLNI